MVDLYIPHPSDCRYNAINQRFWLQYHATNDIDTPTSSTCTHLIKPTDSSADYAARHHLTAFRQWIRITEPSTFIHGPFDFAIVHNRKTRDRIPQSAWDVLALRRDMFSNKVPRFDIPSYSIHVDQSFHTSYHDDAICTSLLATNRAYERPSGTPPSFTSVLPAAPPHPNQ